MVKGVSRRVVVVESPDPNVFEQAIFIVREDLKSGGVSPEQVVCEAAEVARRYMQGTKRGRLRLSPWLYALFGAAVAAAVCVLIFVF